MAVAIILAIMLTFLLYGFAQDGLSETSIGVFVLLYLLLIALGIDGYRSIDVYFDNQHVFLKGRHGIETLSFSRMSKIGLGSTNIRRANILGVSFRNFNGYYIEYFDFASESSVLIHFSSIGVTDDMKQFARLAKEANPRFIAYY